MVNLVGMTAFQAVADDLKSRLVALIADIEEGHTPEILDAKERYSRQYRLHQNDLTGVKDRERDIDPIE